MARNDDYRKERQLLPLDHMKDYRVAQGEPDIRGWTVVSSDRKKIGKVHQLIVDTERMKVRYLDVEVDAKVLDIPKNSHVLVPIDVAHLDDDDERVYVDDFTTQRLATIPPYDHRAINRDYETTIERAYGGASAREERTEPSPGPRPLSPEEIERERAIEDERERAFWRNRRQHDRDYVVRDEERIHDASLEDENEPRR